MEGAEQHSLGFHVAWREASLDPQYLGTTQPCDDLVILREGENDPEALEGFEEAKVHLM